MGRQLLILMTCSLAIVLIILTLLASSPGRETLAANKSSANPNYLPAIENAYQVLTQGFSDSFLTSVSETRFVSGYAALSIKLYHATKQTMYLTNASHAFNDVVGKWTANPMDIGQNPQLKADLSQNSGFFNLEPLLITYQELNTRGMVTQTQSAYVEYYAEQFALYGINNNLVGDNNQLLSRISGVALAMKVFSNNPNRAKWQDYTNKVWNYWWPQRDLNENTGTYNAIGLYELVQLATFTGKYHTLKDQGVRLLFARYRDQLSTMGAMAQYGDDYFGSNWPIWTSVYEVAARLYNDPTFLGAGGEAFWFGQHNYPAASTTPTNNISKLDEYYYLGQVLELKPTTLSPMVTTTHSEISTRNPPPPGKANTSDMLIMAPSRALNAPFVMTELYAQGFHAQLNRRGAVQFYGVGGIPFYHGLDRHNNSAVDGNITPLLPPNQSFPQPIVNNTPGEWSGPPNTWNQESVDTRALTPISPTNPDQVEINTITLRLALPKDVASAAFVIDNLRLVGPIGTKIVDDFETVNNWQRSDNPYALTNAHMQGKSAMEVKLVAGASPLYKSKPFNLTFSIKDYTAIEYDWKYLSPTQLGLSFIFRISQPGGDADTEPGDVNTVPNIDSATVMDRGTDAYSQISMSQYFTYNTSIVRRMVLTQEGVLVIQDILTPGASANGYNAGPIWQFYTLGQHNNNWFDSPGEGHPWYQGDQAGNQVQDKSLLVYFDTAPGRTFGNVQGPKVTNTQYVAQTIYAKQTAKAGTPISFVTVVVPHNTSQAASSVASNITVQNAGQSTTVTVSIEAKPLHITLGAGGFWQVTR
jgi:hypothetical protein